jgi:hypothetical protein
MILKCRGLSIYFSLRILPLINVNKNKAQKAILSFEGYRSILP